MARVSMKKQQILEEKKSKARRFMTPRVKMAKTFEIGKENEVTKNDEAVQLMIASGAYFNPFSLNDICRYSQSLKPTKTMIDKKMARVAMKKQQILEDKKEKARMFMTPRHRSLRALEEISKNVDKVFIEELPKPVQCVQEHTLTKLLEVQKLMHETT